MTTRVCPSLDEAPFSSAKIRAKLVIGFLAALSTQVPTLSQTCLDFREVRPESVYAFSLALIDSFSHAKSSLGRIEEWGRSAERTPQEVAFEMISAFKFAQRDYKCAAKSVEPYKSAENEKIRLAAETAHAVYLTLLKLNQDTLDEYTNPDSEIGSVMERTATIGVEIDDAWKILPAAVALTTHAMVEMPEGSSEKLSALLLTSAERETLKEELRKVFGPEVALGMKSGRRLLEASAGLLYEFLNNPSWKTR